MYRVAIPARYGASRLPGKPLALLAGRPMIEHVYRLAVGSGALEVVVATDDERIRRACAAFGAAVEMTAVAHASGTDRIAEVALRRGWAADSIVVNVQADEPLLPPAWVALAAGMLERDRGADIATLGAPIASWEQYRDANVVKVVTRADGRALYFSRAPIPWCDGGGAEALAVEPPGRPQALRHVGLYAYRVAALRRFAATPPSPLEGLERLEQLRALQAGLAIAVGVVAVAPAAGVDTAADLARVERILSVEHGR